MRYQIRLIEPRDNGQMERLAKDVLAEVQCVGPGLTSEDPELTDMYNAYQHEGSRYWVVLEEKTDRILGGGGFSWLKGITTDQRVCELQKVYFAPAIRGKGLGTRFVRFLLKEAVKLDYREVYLETLPTMAQAVTLYRKLGFEVLAAPMGNTGHFGADIIYMHLPLIATDLDYSAMPFLTAI